MAALDVITAQLVASGVDAGRWIEDAAATEPETPIDQLRPRAKNQLESLAAAGFATAGDITARIDRATAALGGWARNAIVNARAAVGSDPVYRIPDGVTDVPRADIEIDVDMENTNDGVYQWGVLVTDRAHTGLAEPGYRAFVTWDPLTAERELGVFCDFWNWLTDIQSRAARDGFTAKAYCWHENAENSQMLRITAPDTELKAAVTAFIRSPDWVDMLKVFRAGWTTGGSTGLKRIAPLAGFSWDVADPGGGISMLYHERAIDAGHPEQQAARQWLLDYNRGDVEATLAIREWLETTGTAFEPIG